MASRLRRLTDRGATSTGLISLATTYIGKYTAAGYNFDGDIAIVRMYDTGTDSFSAADVAQNYAAQSARFSSFRPDSIDSLSLWVDPMTPTPSRLAVEAKCFPSRTRLT